MTKRRKIILILALALCFAAALAFGLPNVTLLQDETADLLLTGTLSRAALAAFLILLLVLCEQTSVLRFPVEDLPRSLLWCVPCFAVAIVNFPFSALLSGTATVERIGLLPLFLCLCLTIGATEELLFRGILHVVIRQKLQKYRHGYVFSVILSSAIFGLYHLTNLLYGAGVGETLLQAGYSFLIGAMLAVTLDRTENIWLCVLLHALFDVGGTLISYLGEGSPQDTVFWVLTAVFGVLCAVHIIVSALRMDGRAQPLR